MRNHEIVVPRTSRYVVLGAPVSKADELWLVCHGYGQLASSFMRRFGCIDDGTRMIVAPEALSRFYVAGGSGPHSDTDKVGASWMTREARDAEMDDQLEYLDAVVDRVLEGRARAEIPVIALGFSQGAATVCRWAARTARPPHRLILWGSGVPADLLEGAGRAGLMRAPITIVVGSSDPIAHEGRVEAHRRHLDAAGLPYRFVGFAGGHEIDEGVLRSLATRAE